MSAIPGRVAVVTGAAGALGSAVATVLSRSGFRVAAVDRPAAAERLASVVAALEGPALSVPLDVLAVDAWTGALARIDAELGAPSAAALIAGGWAGGRSLHESGAEELGEMIEANLETAARSLRALLPGMVAAGQGSVVVVGSRASHRPDTSAGAAAYAASKAALVALAQATAAEVLERGVRVNAVLPSVIDTPANRAAMPSADPRRWVAPESLSEVIAFLLSDAAKDVSGAAIPVYGRS